MRHIAAFTAFTVFSAASAAQSMNWENVLQRGVNEVIRSMNTPANTATQAPAPTYRTSPPPTASSRPSAAATKPKSAAEQDVDARIAANLGSPAEYRSFFNRMKKAVAASDRSTLALMADYPLRVTQADLKIFTETDFLNNFERLFTPAVNAAVTKQTYSSLFVRDQGAQVGNVLWFTGVCADKTCNRRVPKITAVYAPDAETAAAAPGQPNASPPRGRE